MGYENSAGLGVRNHYGPKLLDESKEFGGEKSLGGALKEMQVQFDYSTLLGAAAITGQMEKFIPAGCQVVDAWVRADTDFVGATTPTMDIGLMQADTTAIDADGLFDGITPALKNAGAASSEDVGVNSGALIGVELGFDAYPVVAIASGTYSAGVGVLTIQYLDTRNDGTGAYVAGGVRGQ